MSRTLALLFLTTAWMGCSTSDEDKDTQETGDPDTDPSTDGTGLLGDTGLDTGDTGVAFDYTWPDTPEDYVFEDVTYLFDIEIPENAGDCCFDFGAISADFILDGTNKKDNALAGLNSFLSTFGGIDLNEQFGFVLQSGTFVGLLDHRSMPAGDGPYAMGFFLGTFDDGTSYDDARLGSGEFLADPQSFKEGTGEPQVAFVPAVKTDDRVVAQGGEFPITVAFGGAPLSLPVQSVSIRGDVEQVAGGVRIPRGELAGYVEIGDFLGAWEDLAKGACACAGVTGDLFFEEDGQWKNNCPATADVEEACGDDPDTDFLCPTILGADVDFSGVGTSGFCDLLPGALVTVSDIDTDGNTSDFEAVSVGLRLRGIEGDVTGLAEESVLSP